MIETSFDESDTIMNTPKGFDPDVIWPLSVFRGTDSVTGYPICVSCFKVTKEELEEIQKTGRIWLTCVGERMTPVRLDGFKPEMHNAEK